MFVYKLSGSNLVAVTKMLSLPDSPNLPDLPSLPFILNVDAPDYGIEHFLAQEKNEELNYISFGGRTLSDTEARCLVLDKELLAVFYAVRKCCVYLYILYQNDFIVHTAPCAYPP